MKPFLLLQSRPEDAASDNEYEAFLDFSGLQENQLKRLRVESGSMKQIHLEKYSAILLGGGPNNVSDPNEKKHINQIKLETKLSFLLDKIIEKDFPFLGACYGIGLLTNHQKGFMSRRYGEDVGALSITITPEGKSDPLLKGVAAHFKAFGGHKEACETLPRSAKLLATSPNCPVQMFRIKTNVYAIQFHPELDSKGLETRINVYRHAGYFPPEAADKLIALGHATHVTEPVKILRNFVSKYQN